MRRFHFGLQKVLVLREYQEQETKLELGRAIGALTQIEQGIGALAAERIRIGNEQGRAGRGTAEIVAFDRYIQRLESTKNRLLEDAAQAKRKVEEAREVYLAASRDRKIIAKVREHQEAEYRQFQLGEETNILDEVGSSQVQRRVHEKDADPGVKHGQEEVEEPAPPPVLYRIPNSS
ncbi:MAG: flagellar export protein FliJ [Treponema sp.]|jgi:flagellar FliJ protein|nr:flagellar export protein FliJ [Treponema sp.]